MSGTTVMFVLSTVSTVLLGWLYLSSRGGEHPLAAGTWVFAGAALCWLGWVAFEVLRPRTSPLVRTGG